MSQLPTLVSLPHATNGLGLLPCLIAKSQGQEGEWITFPSRTHMRSLTFTSRPGETNHVKKLRRKTGEEGIGRKGCVGLTYRGIYQLFIFVNSSMHNRQISAEKV